MEVIFIRIESGEKEALQKESKKLGMTLTTYCRMILIKSLTKEDNVINVIHEHAGKYVIKESK